MKKKLTLVVTSVLLVAALVIGGTLAYFTDTTEAKVNEFTMGNVDIDLIEVFDKDNAQLKPGKDNAVNKDVFIKNIGTNDAYVWYTWKIPAALDSIDGSTGTNNIVHVNSLGRTWDTYRENSKYWAEGQTEALPLEQTWDHDPEVELQSTVGPEGFVGTETIDGIEYNVYLVLYHGELGAGETTTQAMDQVYLDTKVDFDGTNYTINGNTINYDFSKNVKIIVTAYAIQADGFDNVYDAYKAFS